MKRFWAMILSMLIVASLLPGALADTVYTGSAQGMTSQVSVTVTMDDAGKVTALDVDESGETYQMVGVASITPLVDAIVDAGGANGVDVLTGATFTSNAILTVVKEAQKGGPGDGRMTPGVYAGSAHGSKSTIKMAVEVTEDRIVNVWNLENGDTPVVSDLAVKTVAQQIVDEQSLAVDGISGATLTGRAAVSAVAQALESAGANVQSYYISDTPAVKPEGPTEEVDVVIVGAGASGLSTALALKTDDELGFSDSGLNVLVVENNGFVGGDVNFSGGYVASPYGTVLNDVTGVSLNPDEFVPMYMESFPEFAELMNQTVFENVFRYSSTALTGLINRGLYLNAADAQEMYGYTAGVTADRNTGLRDDEGMLAPMGSPYLGESLGIIARDAGLNIRLNTHADSLIIESGVCKGIRVTGPDSTYQINAKRIILCTGSASADAKTVELFWPEFEGVVQASNGANKGDAQRWIYEMGGEVAKAHTSVWLGFDPILGSFYSDQIVLYSPDTVWVNVNGERFMDESAEHDAYPVLGQPEHHAYVLFDQNNACTAWYEHLAFQNLAWRADSIEELAESIGVNAENLKATIEAYNSDAAGSGDRVFGIPADQMAPLLTAPFYAVRANATVDETNLSLYVDDNMNVLMSKEGEPIVNLYAAGGVVGINLPEEYGPGFHIMSALTSGAYAGNCVRESLINPEE